METEFASGRKDSVTRVDSKGNTTAFEDWNPDGSHKDTLYEKGAFEATIDFGADDATRSVRLANATYTGEQIGVALGSTLGRAIGDGNVLVEIGASTILGTLLKNVGNAITLGFTGDILDPLTGTSLLASRRAQSFSELGAQFGDGLQAQVSSVLSSLIVGELAEALDLSGFEGQVFSIVGNTVASRFTNGLIEAARTGDASLSALTTGFNLTDMAAGMPATFAALFGQELASKALPADNSHAALFASGAAAVGSLIGATIGSALPVVGTFVGSFVGQLAGTWAGNNLFDDDREAYVKLGLTASGDFGRLAWATHDGGNVAVAAVMGQTVTETVGDLIEATGARIDSNRPVTELDVGYYTNTNGEIIVIADPLPGEQAQALYGHVSGARDSEALGRIARYGAEQVLATLDVLGGDPILKRAFYASRDKGLLKLGEDLQTAESYRAYLKQPDVINALIAAEPTSAFSAGWVVTLQRAEELGLNQHSPNDLRGGIAANLRDRGLNGEFLEWTPDLHADDATMLLLRKLNHTVDIRDAFGPGRVDREAGTAGGDELDFGGRASTAMVHADGGAGDDSLYGHDATDILVGGAGNDGLDGRAGHDWLHGGDGNDNLRGGDGDDLLVGSAGNDTLNGDRGTDTLVGGEGDDVIVIDMSERDVIQAASAGSRAQTDSVRIANADGLASDFARRGADLDIMLRKGSAAAGTLTVADFFLTRHALDTLVFSDDGRSFAGEDVWRNEVGDVRVNETVTEANGERRQLMLDGQLSESWTSIDTRFAVNGGQNVLKSETVYRDDGGDEVRYGDAANSIYADAPNQSWDALGGDDRIYGTNGTDTLIGGTGNDGLAGEGGDDEIEGGAGADEMNGGDGRDWVDYSRSPGGGVQSYLAAGVGDRFDATGDRYNAIENIRGSAGGDDLRGDDGANRLRGHDGNDQLVGGAGDDELEGGAGADQLYGEDGDDFLAGEAGADLMAGGDGLDWVDYASSPGGGVQAYLASNTGDRYDANGDTYSGIENLRGSAGGDDLRGDDGANRLRGHGGNDQLVGGAGDDRLEGEDGDDQLYGQDGRDELNGGAGADMLTGGVGEDAFVFDTALSGSVDRIEDFNVADDTIWLDNAVFTVLSGGALHAEGFHAGTAAHDSSDRILYNQSTGALSYDADGEGAVAAIQFARLATNLNLGSGDFVVV